MQNFFLIAAGIVAVALGLLIKGDTQYGVYCLWIAGAIFLAVSIHAGWNWPPIHRFVTGKEPRDGDDEGWDVTQVSLADDACPPMTPENLGFAPEPESARLAEWLAKIGPAERKRVGDGTVVPINRSKSPEQ